MGTTISIHSGDTLRFLQLEGTLLYQLNYGSYIALANSPTIILLDENGDTDYAGVGSATVIFDTMTLGPDTATSIFSIGSGGLNIVGNGLITIHDTGDYEGLLTINGAYGNIHITNIHINVEASYLYEGAGGGWVVRLLQGEGLTYVTDSSITYCSSTGDVGQYCGGIVGYGNTIPISKCYSSGNIDSLGGGICGQMNQAVITDCFSYGEITGGGGGICAVYNNAVVSRCYSMGNIGSFSGGIVGGYNAGNIINCYTLGNVDTQGGAIAGSNNTGNITNCYTIGATIGLTHEDGLPAYFAGQDGSTFALTNCYSESYNGGDSWSDAHADATLQTGYVKVDPENQYPYLLSAFQYYNFDPTTATTTWNNGEYYVEIPTFDSDVYTDPHYSVLSVISTIDNVNNTENAYINDGEVFIILSNFEDVDQTITVTLFTHQNGDFPYFPYNFSTFELTVDGVGDRDFLYYTGKHFISNKNHLIPSNKTTNSLLLKSSIITPLP